jgi:hypothetical protein
MQIISSLGPTVGLAMDKQSKQQYEAYGGKRAAAAAQPDPSLPRWPRPNTDKKVLIDWRDPSPMER